jgi:hypothetical protein
LKTLRSTVTSSGVSWNSLPSSVLTVADLGKAKGQTQRQR